MNELAQLTKAIIACTELEKVKAIVWKALDRGAKPMKVVDAVAKGLDRVGDLYERGEYFLMELTIAGSTASDIMAMIKPVLESSAIPVRGKVVIGTVLGDFHNIGKDIVIAMLESAGFDVINLGVDVSTERFLSAIQETKPHVVAMSGLLTIVVDEMKKVIDALQRDGLRDSVKVMIGGRAVSQKFANEIGADGFGTTAIDAVRLVKKWIEGN